MTHRPPELLRTYCRICMAQCGVVAEVVGERIVNVRGDRDHPLTKGYTCPKGRAMGEAHHVGDALTRPMMRTANGVIEVSWDDALDDIARRLRAILDAHGPDAVAINFGSGLGLDAAGYAMEESFYRALGTPPKFSPLTIDGTAKTMVATAMAGFPLNPKVDYDNVELLISVGTNPVVSHAHNTGMYDPVTWIRSVAHRGEVWTLDPVSTATARLSTRHLATFPGQDYAALAWLVRELIDGGPCRPKQPVTGLPELRAALDGFDLVTAARIAGVDEVRLIELLASIRRTGRVAVETGTGVTMSAGANLAQWFGWLIMILTGSMNETGGVWFHPGFIRPFDAMELPVLPTFTPGSNVRPDVKGIMGDWPGAVLPLEIEAGTIRALFNFGGNLLRAFPDTTALEAALPKLELNVVTEIVHNELTPLSSHVLPTKDPVERADLTRWDTLAWNLSMQYTPPVVPPMGERRSAWWVISQIMRRTGLPVGDWVPDDDRAEGADDVVLATLMSRARCSFETLREERYVELPLDVPAEWPDRHVERIGGWRLAPPELVEQWHALRLHAEASLDSPRRLVLIPRRQAKKLNAQLGFLGEPAEALLHPATAAEHGVHDGDTVRIHNERGAITLSARVDPSVRRDVCSVPHGHLDANVNVLTSTDDIDPLGGMALYSGIPVAIEAVPRT